MMTMPAEAPQTTSLSLHAALDRILDTVVPITATERVSLDQALHRVLAVSIRAQANVPAHTNSAMDGYAVRAADVASAETRLPCAGESFAGHPYSGALAQGQCVRIMTGAVLPEGADSVVMQEHTRSEGEVVCFDRPARQGDNIRHAGEDLAKDDVVLSPGRYLQPADIGVLASVGVSQLEVVRRPRVALFSTGDELRPVGVPLRRGDIHDSNRYTMRGLLSELGVEIRDLGIVADTPEALEAAFAQAKGCDAVMSSGGVSVGAADHVLAVLQRVGNVGFWKVAIKPGKPLAFGHIGNALFFGLPGNPVSAMVTLMQLARPALVKLAGATPAPPLRFMAPCVAPVRKKPGRAEFQRACLCHDRDGLAVRPLEHQGSGVLRSMSRADCFIVLEANAGDQEAGTPVLIEPFAQPIWNGAEA